ncbi:MAG: DNA repair protein RecN [Acutalibacteraceae bacterium]|nr:DNA repair protein RecN [Acutalibacteraceae bacterium]
MLVGLKIENIAVIESAEIELGSGLNVMTGETGAGKSIVIDAINAVLGERTSRELIRTGADSARVYAEFADVSSETQRILDEMGIEKMPDDTLVLSRSINASGKNICRINGCPATVSALKEIGAGLINIHGQHDSQALLSPDKHCGFIDLLAENQNLRSEYRQVFSSLVSVKKELDLLYDTRDEKAARLDYLNFVIGEIEQAQVREGERDELAKEKELLQHSGRVIKALEKAYSALSDEAGILSGIEDCAGELEAASKYYKDAENAAKGVRSISYELSDYAAEIRGLAEGFDYSPERLSEINERLDFLYRLSMKYGATEKDILDTFEKSVAERNAIEVSDERISELEEKLYALSDEIKILSAKLTESRMNTAAEFEKKVKAELEFLDMPKVEFIVERKATALTSKGADAIEFLISANAGQEPRPIAKIASGGELSRIMLAIKNVLSDKDSVDTLIFDEIDTGVSGSAAEKIALKLHQVSKGRQVICVTHLARIAAQADSHMKIIKTVADGKTYTKIDTLDFDGRAAEIARITAGGNVTALQIETAKEMLGNARRDSV